MTRYTTPEEARIAQHELAAAIDVIDTWLHDTELCADYIPARPGVRYERSRLALAWAWAHNAEIALTKRLWKHGVLV